MKIATAIMATELAPGFYGVSILCDDGEICHGFVGPVSEKAEAAAALMKIAGITLPPEAEAQPATQPEPEMFMQPAATGRN